MMEVLVGPELLELPELPTLELPELGVMGDSFTGELLCRWHSHNHVTRIHIQVSVASLVNPVHGRTQSHRSFLKLTTVF